MERLRSRQLNLADEKRFGEFRSVLGCCQTMLCGATPLFCNWLMSRSVHTIAGHEARPVSLSFRLVFNGPVMR